ncbi:hypothetical protein HYH03_002295 [Edaphochlamys debaryana]|uniref:Guanylate cyclase domain-containing protein n=1 Tax=Edaphochlamys debaryana TaxID=47281 RepID=A0A835YC82_9CHLO|nr:hypothetical protein HYH03_002295 [Edaphochlamys debaryana]|eukprot:KAG2500013.1 hypothetical protein HYH03_002295 [Edaphochlamys debaryana]
MTRSIGLQLLSWVLLSLASAEPASAGCSRTVSALADMAQLAAAETDQAPQVLRLGVPRAYAPWVGRALQQLPASLQGPLNGTEVQSVPDPGSDPTASADAWLVPSYRLADLVAGGSAADVSRLVYADRGLAWWDMAPQLRDALAVVDNRVVAMPIGAGPLLLWYRGDVLGALAAEVPRTWQQLLAFAERYATSRRPGQPPHAFCLPLGPDCTHLHLLSAVWASVAQTRSRRQGLAFDPWAGAPRIDTAGLRYALELLANLSRHSEPSWRQQGPGGSGCGSGASNSPFTSGACALTLATAALSAELSNPAAARAVEASRFDLAPCPGSELVWSNVTDSMVSCTEASCPLGEGVPAGNGSQAPTGRRMNRSPQLTAVSLTGVINASAAPLAQLRAYLFFRHLANGSAAALEDPTLPFRGAALPLTRVSLLDVVLDPLPTLSLFTAAAPGKDLQTAAMRMGGAALSHPNAGWDMSIPRGSELRAILAELLSHAVDCASESGTAGVSPSCGLSDRLRAAQVRAEAAFPPNSFIAAYRNDVGLNDLLPWRSYDYITTDAAQGGSPGKHGRNMLVVGIVAGLCGLVLTAALVLLLHRQKLTLLGHVVSKLVPQRRPEAMAPGPSQDSCLVITDIQDSTALWEALPAAVMDASVGLHHACLRRLLLKHWGYESATEGDSFILAFRRSCDALAFALDAQTSLMQLEWPELLLQERICAPIWTSLPAGFPFTSRPGLTLAVDQDVAEPDSEALSPQHGDSDTQTGMRTSSATGTLTGIAASGANVRHSVARDCSASTVMEDAGEPVVGPSDLYDDLRLTGASSSGGAPPPSPMRQAHQQPHGAPIIHRRSPGGHPDEARISSEFATRRTRHSQSPPLCRRSVSAGSTLSRRRLTGDNGPAAYLTGPFALRGPARSRAALQSAEQDEMPSGSALPETLGCDGAGGFGSGLRAKLGAFRFTTLAQWMAQQANAATVRGGGMLRRQTSWADHGQSCEARSLKSGGNSGMHFPRPTPSNMPTVACVFRGLRVRIGVSCGPTTAAEVSHNAASQRTVYGGPSASIAKQVSDAAHGGMVTLSGGVAARLGAPRTRVGANEEPHAKMPPYWAVRSGRYELDTGGPTDLYVAWPEQLTQRMALLPPPRCAPKAVMPTVYDAPVSLGALAYLLAPHLPTLLAWDVVAARAALATLCDIGCREAIAHGGYLASAPFPDSHFPASSAASAPANEPPALVAAFRTALDAARWALSVQDALSAADWPHALLGHELCQEAVLPLLPTSAAGEAYQLQAQASERNPQQQYAPGSASRGVSVLASPRRLTAPRYHAPVSPGSPLQAAGHGLAPLGAPGQDDKHHGLKSSAELLYVCDAAQESDTPRFALGGSSYRGLAGPVDSQGGTTEGDAQLNTHSEPLPQLLAARSATESPAKLAGPCDSPTLTRRSPPSATAGCGGPPSFASPFRTPTAAELAEPPAALTADASGAAPSRLRRSAVPRPSFLSRIAPTGSAVSHSPGSEPTGPLDHAAAEAVASFGSAPLGYRWPPAPLFPDASPLGAALHEPVDASLLPLPLGTTAEDADDGPWTASSNTQIPEEASSRMATCPHAPAPSPTWASGRGGAPAGDTLDMRRGSQPRMLQSLRVKSMNSPPGSPQVAAGGALAPQAPVRSPMTARSAAARARAIFAGSFMPRLSLDLGSRKGKMMQQAASGPLPSPPPPATLWTDATSALDSEPLVEAEEPHDEEWVVRVRGLRVQAGIDIGQLDWSVPHSAASPLLFDGSVARKARKLAASARPGQILLSRPALSSLVTTQTAQYAASAALVQRRLPTDTSMSDLGDVEACFSVPSNDAARPPPALSPRPGPARVGLARATRTYGGGGVPAPGPLSFVLPQRPVSVALLRARKGKSSGDKNRSVYVCKIADSWHAALFSMSLTQPAPVHGTGTGRRDPSPSPLPRGLSSTHFQSQPMQRFQLRSPFLQGGAASERLTGPSAGAMSRRTSAENGGYIRRAPEAHSLEAGASGASTSGAGGLGSTSIGARWRSSLWATGPVAATSWRQRQSRPQSANANTHENAGSAGSPAAVEAAPPPPPQVAPGLAARALGALMQLAGASNNTQSTGCSTASSTQADLAAMLASDTLQAADRLSQRTSAAGALGTADGGGALQDGFAAITASAGLVPAASHPPTSTPRSPLASAVHGARQLLRSVTGSRHRFASVGASPELEITAGNTTDEAEAESPDAAESWRRWNKDRPAPMRAVREHQPPSPSTAGSTPAAGSSSITHQRPFAAASSISATTTTEAPGLSLDGAKMLLPAPNKSASLDEARALEAVFSLTFSAAAAAAGRGASSESAHSESLQLSLRSQLIALQRSLGVTPSVDLSLVTAAGRGGSTCSSEDRRSPQGAGGGGRKGPLAAEATVGFGFKLQDDWFEGSASSSPRGSRAQPTLQPYSDTNGASSVDCSDYEGMPRPTAGRSPWPSPPHAMPAGLAGLPYTTPVRVPLRRIESARPAVSASPGGAAGTAVHPQGLLYQARRGARSGSHEPLPQPIGPPSVASRLPTLWRRSLELGRAPLPPAQAQTHFHAHAVPAACAFSGFTPGVQSGPDDSSGSCGGRAPAPRLPGTGSRGTQLDLFHATSLNSPGGADSSAHGTECTMLTLNAGLYESAGQGCLYTPERILGQHLIMSLDTMIPACQGSADDTGESTQSRRF